MAKSPVKVVDQNASQEERQTAALETIAENLVGILREMRKARKGGASATE